jgi:two-component system CheB/CheR fusion protein
MGQPEEQNGNFDELLAYLHRTRGFDFSGYKRTSLQRRIHKRMEAVGAEHYEQYTDYLEVHPDEFSHLFNTILINVTDFFRDPAAWDYLTKEVVTRIVNVKLPADPIRIWSAGCASGEEAYTLAMILCEAVGPDRFREHVKIYGTDLDLDALNQARQGLYPPRQNEEINPELREKYFEPNGDRLLFRKDLRRSVIFGRHDLTQDAPISRLDLLVCRNTLMYFNAEVQSRIIERFHFAINDGGYLFLGKAEMLLAQSPAFSPVDLKQRIFRKIGTNNRTRFWPTPRSFADPLYNPLLNHVRLRDASFDSGALPQVVIDANGILAMANQQARALFGVVPRDLGQPFQDVEMSFRPVDLRTQVETAQSENRPVILRDAEWRRGPEQIEYYEIQICPLRDNSTVLGTSITFANVSATRRAHEELQTVRQELESASEELQSTNEELETTNEELQSTVEELETTNEELQSTNEELETMNEELQSANEELQTMNDELRQRSEELNHVNSFLQSILSGFQGSVVVLDKDLTILVWSHRAEETWGLRGEEVQGKQFLNLDIGLPVMELRQPIRECLNGSPNKMVTLDAVNRRGKPIHCEVTCTPLSGDGDDGPRGVILMMEDAKKSS